MEKPKTKYALMSVFDKTGVVELATHLETNGYTVIATGNTYKTLIEAGIKNVTKIEDVTNFPEIMDGRVKTLHPKIFGGILSLRDDPRHLRDMLKNGITPIDFVVVNLYPFRDKMKENLSEGEMLEYIDIGGVSLIRAAAKNFKNVCVLVSPSNYSTVISFLKKKKNVPEDVKRFFAYDAFRHTADYDAEISRFLEVKAPKGVAPENIPGGFPFGGIYNLALNKIQDLRYGENPHQKAAYYGVNGRAGADFKKLSGKDISYNNILDIDASLSILKDFSEDEFFASVVKHTNPCGAALSKKSLKDAFLKARKADEVSSFGGIVAFNRIVDARTANEIKPFFIEIIIAPGYDKEAEDILKSKKNLIIIEYSMDYMNKKGGLGFRGVLSGLLVQEKDDGTDDSSSFKTVTKKRPGKGIMEDLLFAWKITRHVKSNAIVYVKNGVTVGIGAGQMSRIDSAKFAREKMVSAFGNINGFVMASDGFFPFKDSVEYAGKIGAVGIIEPGGSVRDEEVIKEADRLGIPMVFTGARHFKH